jgi:hypothetical protein
MVTGYHKQIEDALITLGEKWVGLRKIKKVCRGSQYPLSIVDPRSKYVMNYQPDVYYVLRNNRKLIFEVLDTEIEKQDAIVADVICSFLVENVDGLFFIYPEPASHKEIILEALVTVYKGLVRKGVVGSELPNFKKTGAYLVTRKEASRPSKLKEKLIKYASEDGWFRSLPIVSR